MGEIFRTVLFDKFKVNYENLLGRDFDSFYDSLRADLTSIDDIQGRELILKNIFSNVKKTKKRWLDKILRDKSSQYMQDIEFAKSEFNKVLNKKLSLKKFESYFGTTDLETYIKNKLEPLEEWKNSTESLLTDFPMLKVMNKVALKSAFRNDIIVVYSKLCYEEESRKDNTTKVPTILSQIPVDTTSKMSFLTEEQKKDLDKRTNIDTPSTIDRYIMIDENEQNKLLLQLEQKTYIQIKEGGNSGEVSDLLTQIALIKSVKYLNPLDVKIISYYYTHFHKIVLGDPIEKSIYQIVLDLGLSNQVKNYEAVENSIAKLGSTKLSYNLEGNSVNGILLESSIYVSNGVKMARVYLGSILKELIIKKSTLEYDGDIFNSLGGDAQQLAIWLQKRRYKASITNEGYDETIHLSKFSTAIYWNTKRLDRKRDRIIKALDELKKSNLIIKDFTYAKKIFSFEVEYIPLSPIELARINTPVSEKQNVIEGNHLKRIE
ncbi:MAG: hypothetical protein SPJ62_00165 [Inconstantimicrobium porci]|uniref:Uncharacterized protein n=1 Tax=Inconstantimicrobium porci TaxID=2652291 RepID=A0A7X2MYF6_9CLOT|nr:hypothetical protein [Inconstantimicrobium porci]MDD6770323.1 hypothetical protein [Inconstantimicrobium porci]MDY5910440.1 hypothetical protein [Inconstantimicrobium porci]MSR91386.1 hypothetical protein [Inconstantimicrobium porci]